MREIEKIIWVISKKKAADDPTGVPEELSALQSQDILKT